MTGGGDKAEVRAAIREFLTTRRAGVSPQDAGLPTFGTRRRVRGLRREEVATLAGISVDYYTQIERGDAGGVSESVLTAVAAALQLDPAERAHLTDLVRAAGSPVPRRPRGTRPVVRPAVRRVLESMADSPAFVVDGHLDILAANDLGRALYQPLYDHDATRPNHARFLFLDRGARAFWSDWELATGDTVALLRAQAGRDPFDPVLTQLVGELSTRSEEFRTRWASHDVRAHDSGTKRIHHPVVGDLALPYETFPVAADEGQLVLVYSAEPGTPSRDALDLLSTWCASQAGQTDPADRTARAER